MEGKMWLLFIICRNKRRKNSRKTIRNSKSKETSPCPMTLVEEIVSENRLLTVYNLLLRKRVLVVNKFAVYI